MASLTKVYASQKLKGQIYTPATIVNKILDNVDYQGVHILGKSIIDPACGDGQFLIEIVKRIIHYSKPASLAYHLSFVYGWDIDEQAIQKCIQNLNELLDNEGLSIDWNIKAIDWKIAAQNALKKIKCSLFAPELHQEFDFVVGNPPYIRIQHLALEERKYIQKHYEFCKSGSTDIYLAFFELCLDLLKDSGICGLITPNTFLYTETARTMRNRFVQQDKHCQLTLLRQITNYGAIQLFENATTYSAITIFGKKTNDSFVYEQALNQEKIEKREITAEEIVDKPIWQLSLHKNTIVKGKKLGEICHIHVGLTTLCDKGFIFANPTVGKQFFTVYSKILHKNIKIETAILKPIIKGSTHKQGNLITEYILFPYQKDLNNKYQIITEADLIAQFPYAYQYLESIKNELDKRDNGAPNPAAWYAFGRNQGLDTSFGKKIIFSPMNREPNFILSDNEGATVYSGYFIKFAGDKLLTDKLLQQLNSARMKDFVAVSSRDFRGGYKAYNKKIIENFIIDVEALGD
ncbi:MAG: N-6 DNA methylase [Microscillaceae bacterium]|jgi:predicted RNA methylase|nr:N-6 DNA methylase [Microscillaceae bacterium]